MSLFPKWPQEKLFVVLLGILLAYGIVWTGAEIRKTLAEGDRVGVADAQPATITVSGEGKITAAPNIALVTVGHTTESSDVGKAQDENSKKMNALLSALKALGIADADLQTADYSVNPKYSYNEKTGESKITGYVVSQNVRVKIRDLTKVGAVLGKAGELRANQVSGLSFTMDDPKLVEAQARSEAIKDAKKQALILARSLGVRLVRIVNFSEGGGFPPPLPYAFAERAVGGPEIPQIEPGTQEVQSSVTITFEVE